MDSKKPAAVERAILEVIRKRGQQGLTDEEIQERVTAAQDKTLRINAYNALLKKGKVKLLKRTSDGKILYTVASPAASKLTGLTINENALYQLIEKSQNKGIWSRDLKMMLNIPKKQWEEAIKTLETRKLVKTVQSASQRNKKIYMLYELQPGQELTGGPWYNEQNEYDLTFINVICRQIKNLVDSKSDVTVDDICSHLNSSGVFRERLLNEHVEQVLGTMIYDGTLAEYRDKESNPGAKASYYSPKPVPTLNSLTDVPCGVCPVLMHCHPNGDISPETCKYFEQWLGSIDW
eukprot:Plantae.Rhodophyta-Purpureofilum_apyrenoidigerum.ctg7768.p1 GENE.Plantae.Rhodophyta-Purpureofilum_apyrenoidigerum.ctg7768~~Plantae.Rhodophyta-Purpureofilum_apyrenoidigerum.ctg7768.p1  ORF type:complete len:292 (-),score=55.47 Plantae.Rhodophyta-Purpureofilum_apyrenoidigerum.ctg7768:358-1233(-)